MSNDIESQKGTTGDVPSEELQKLLEQIKTTKMHQKAFWNYCRECPEDPDIDKLLREKRGHCKGKNWQLRVSRTYSCIF